MCNHIIKMTNLTLSIPDELHERMKRHSEIRWSEIVRRTITQKIEVLDVLDNIASKSKLTKKDIDALSHKINKEVFVELNKK